MWKTHFITLAVLAALVVPLYGFDIWMNKSAGSTPLINFTGLITALYAILLGAHAIVTTGVIWFFEPEKVLPFHLGGSLLSVLVAVAGFFAFEEFHQWNAKRDFDAKVAVQEEDRYVLKLDSWKASPSRFFPEHFEAVVLSEMKGRLSVHFEGRTADENREQMFAGSLKQSVTVMPGEKTEIQFPLKTYSEGKLGNMTVTLTLFTDERKKNEIIRKRYQTDPVARTFFQGTFYEELR